MSGQQVRRDRVAVLASGGVDSAALAVELAAHFERVDPISDNSSAFFQPLTAALNEGLNGELRIIRPFARSSKAAVLRRFPELPWNLTFSCLAPDSQKRHCGSCNKCAERRRAFAQARITDPTEYRGGLPMSVGFDRSF